MAKMTWHTSGTKEFEAGVKDVALFPMSSGSYGTGVAWNGVTAINESPSGADATDLYADDEKYATLRSAERFGFTIEAYTYPDEWMECDGSKEAVTGVYLGQQTRKGFGLVYKTSIGDESHPSLDKGFKLHIIYNATASPSGRSYGTINENPDAITMSWEATSSPTPVQGSTDYKGVCCITVDSTKFTTTTAQAALNDLLSDIYGRDAVVADSITEKTPTLKLPHEVIAALTVSAGAG